MRELDELKRVIVINGEPEPIRETELEAAIAHFGALPADYVAFVRHFGRGMLGIDYLHLYAPSEMVTRAEEELIVHRRMAASFPDHYEGITWYPEPGGLLPFGMTTTAIELFWRTEGLTPDRWTVHVRHRGGENQDFPGGIAALLYSMVNEEYSEEYLEPSVFTERPIVFEPIRPPTPEQLEKLAAYKELVEDMAEQLEAWRKHIPSPPSING